MKKMIVAFALLLMSGCVQGNGIAVPVGTETHPYGYYLIKRMPVNICTVKVFAMNGRQATIPIEYPNYTAVEVRWPALNIAIGNGCNGQFIGEDTAGVPYLLRAGDYYENPFE